VITWLSTKVGSFTRSNTTPSLKETPLLAGSSVVHDTVMVVAVTESMVGPAVMTGAVVSGTASVVKLITPLCVGLLPSGSVDSTCA